MGQVLQNVLTAQVKAIGATSDTCTVKLTYADGSVTPTLEFTLRAYASLAKLTQDIAGAFDLELLRYSAARPTLVSDVIVIDSADEGHIRDYPFTD